jgi:flagellar P-ring protein precursor FlgI
MDAFIFEIRQMCLAAAVLAALALAAPLAAPADAASRIKDIVDVEGARKNQLKGVGLVVGLPGTGDTFRNSPFTRQGLTSFLEAYGYTKEGVINARNVAIVSVTADLPPFATPGTPIDVSISAIGDAKSLQGGVLMPMDLFDASGSDKFAAARGPVTIGGFSAGGASGSSVTKGVPTSGRISGGATVERETGYDLAGQASVRLSLRNPDLTTAQRIAAAINSAVGAPIAKANNPAVVVLNRTEDFRGDMVDLLTKVETLEVEPDLPARVVIDENSGIIVMGENVRVATAAIAQGALTVTVSEKPAVSQPAPLSQGQTAVVPSSDVKVEEGKGSLALIQGGVPLKQLVEGLNRLGVGPRDMISILQALKAAGAIQAEIQVM